ncbi:Glycine betaine ABC transport system, glycine betaine-binding protein OpuAC [Methanosarcina horonobensis HB-1 = JCM 15518]|uniref:Glycine betaine ABC transport system, glycine betaine-binding protein OpuAC n=2 Tax=Methanosarcina horonobensis TaxID=418008 RepID=A0A0E3WTL0_9EURY|nr:Glycine betaine ABC transport system, glycine betaine-binding protein OpuAC [Methanosarcina horonobensis HB-1 = JCM 15518]
MAYGLEIQEIPEEKPNLYGILTRFQWTHDNIQAVMMDIENGMTPQRGHSKVGRKQPGKSQQLIAK